MANEMNAAPIKRWQTWYALIAFLYMYLPIAVLTIFSFNKSPSPSQWTGFTWEWYAKFLQNPTLLAALKNSLSVALTAVSVAAVLGTLTAVGLARYYFPGKNLYRGATYLPLIIPDIAIAVATLVFFAAIKIQLSLVTIVIAHIVFCLAYIAVVVSSRLATIDPKLEEAALDLGATPVQAFFRVLLPQLLPGILSGSLLAFILSMDDFVIAYFTAGVGSTTLPIAIFSSLRNGGVTPELNALSVLLIIASASIASIAEVIRSSGTHD
ncbi:MULTISPECIES: ABC transporter permease [Pseudanabaena]|uniref:ABC-type transporter, integral membrane subunit n=2 Tax=Pseudanabaena TaxID=1152 RepID=L8N588_9CYAN|nr:MULTISPECIES: ABC transporter permease [Pseudanabaena]ELS33860.1 ABC-type transporter, integral membrane subunit [Pseudanabaena biceps PCC 7429]MDG3493955.1 ABC transporter permease [Pseudanabaena catenata USMAC16]